MIHTLFCGFGAAAESAAKTLLRQGHPGSSIQVLEADRERSTAAHVLGLTCQPWSAPDIEGLRASISPSLTKIIVNLAADHHVAPIVQFLRAKLPSAVIAVVVLSEAAGPAALASGASLVVNEAKLAASLLAETVCGSSQAGPGLH